MARKKKYGWGGARPGSGRPPKAPEDKFVTRSICLPPELARRLDALVAEDGRSFSVVASDLLARAVAYKRKRGSS